MCLLLAWLRYPLFHWSILVGVPLFALLSGLFCPGETGVFFLAGSAPMVAFSLPALVTLAVSGIVFMTKGESKIAHPWALSTKVGLCVLPAVGRIVQLLSSPSRNTGAARWLAIAVWGALVWVVLHAGVTIAEHRFGRRS